MLLLVFLVSLLTAHTSGLSRSALDFSVDYYKYRDVEVVCLLMCEKDLAFNTFAKQASRENIKLSLVNTRVLVNSTKVGKCLRQDVASIGVILDPTCTNFRELMYHASQNTLLDTTRKWLIIYEDSWLVMEKETKRLSMRNTLPEIVKIVGQLNISVDADITLAIREDMSSYRLYETFNYGKIQGGELVMNKAGTWNQRKGIQACLNGYKYYRRWNFRQFHMRMSIVVSPAPKLFDPKILTDRTLHPGLAVITQTAGTILEVVAEIHNISYIYSIADRWVGDFNKNSSKVTVTSSLYNQQQDISPVIRFLKDVYEHIDVLLPPLTAIETRYYYLIPTHGAGKFENQFLRPLSSGAWLTTLAVTVVCALMLLLSAKLERRPSAGQYALFSIIAAICQQFFEDSVETRRVSVARKLTILVTGVSCLLIYNYYTSSVVSWLLNGPPPSINSLEELLESPLELIYEDIGYTQSWLQVPTYYFNKRNAKVEDEIRNKKVLYKKKNAPLLMPLQDGIKMVKGGGYAYHTEVDSAKRLISRTFTQRELCNLGSLQSMEMTVLYPCMQKNSPYKEFFVWSIMRLKERGIVRCIQHRTAAPQVKCEGSSPRALALGGAAPAFSLLAAGYILATAIMLVERVLWQYKYNHFEIRKEEYNKSMAIRQRGQKY